MAFTVKSILSSQSARYDFNGDGRADLLWRGADGTLAVWSMDANSSTIMGSMIFPNPDPRGNTMSLKGAGDVNGDGTTDFIWQTLAGRLETWTIHDNQVSAVIPLTKYGLYNDQVRATGDFNGDGRTDLLWFARPAQEPGAFDGVWYTSSADNRPIPPLGLGAIKPFSIDFQFVGVGDFDGDGRDGLLFRGTGNATVGTMMIQEPEPFDPGDYGMPTWSIYVADPGGDWSVLGLADFNGDNKDDIAWQHVSGARSIWLMDGGKIVGGGMLLDPGPDWKLADIGDYNNDGSADLLWRNVTNPGIHANWMMNGSLFVSHNGLFNVGSDFWSLV